MFNWYILALEPPRRKDRTWLFRRNADQDIQICRVQVVVLVPVRASDFDLSLEPTVRSRILNVLTNIRLSICIPLFTLSNLAHA